MMNLRKHFYQDMSEKIRDVGGEVYYSFISYSFIS